MWSRAWVADVSNSLSDAAAPSLRWREDKSALVMPALLLTTPANPSARLPLATPPPLAPLQTIRASYTCSEGWWHTLAAHVSDAAWQPRAPHCWWGTRSQSSEHVALKRVESCSRLCGREKWKLHTAMLVCFLPTTEINKNKLWSDLGNWSMYLCSCRKQHWQHLFQGMWKKNCSIQQLLKGILSEAKNGENFWFLSNCKRP